MNKYKFLGLAAAVTCGLMVGNSYADNEVERTLNEAGARAKLDGKALVDGLGDEKTNGLITDSSRALQRFTTGDKTTIPKSILAKAKCVIVFPSVAEGAIVVGGAGGSGIATCRTGSLDEWSNPAFVTYGAGSLGVQLGAKSSSIVALILSNKAIEQLKQGKIDLSAEVEVAAGNNSAEESYGKKDMVMYDDASGAFIGASLSVGRISEDKTNQTAFYHQYQSTREALERTDIKTFTTSDGLNAFYKNVKSATATKM